MSEDSHSVHERWARMRFAVIGPLLAAPPEPGQLQAALKALAAKPWRHPISGEAVRFSFATLERWYYAARRAAHDPVAALRPRRRVDAGCHRRLSEASREVLHAQYERHRSWSVQLHVDNLAAEVAEQPALGPMPSYATVRRYLRTKGMNRRRGRWRPSTSGAALAEQRLASREVRSYELAHVNALWHADFHVDVQGVHHFGLGLGGELEQAAGADRPVAEPHPLSQLLVGDHVDAGTVGSADVQRDGVRLLAVERSHHAFTTGHVFSPRQEVFPQSLLGSYWVGRLPSRLPSHARLSWTGRAVSRHPVSSVALSCQHVGGSCAPMTG